MKKIAMLLLVCLCGCATPRPWTKTEKAAAIFFVAAHTFDAYTTERHQDHPERFHEINNVMGRHPSDKRIIVYFGVTGLGALILAHYLPDLRLPLLGSYGAANAYWGIHNVRKMREEEKR